MTPLDIDTVYDEIRSMYRDLGREPTQDEWKKVYQHSAGCLRMYGGFAQVRQDAVDSMEKDWVADEVPNEDVPIEELVAHRKRQFEHKKAHEEASKLQRIRVKLDGPVALVHLGDPHVDDDGTDIGQLEHDKEVVNATEGMFAGNVGDTTNNWCGRLARLYAEQSTSSSQAWRLAEWFLNGLDLMYLIAGNHDLWSGSGDPLKWIKTRKTIYKKSQVRINLVFPNKREVRINARHDFKGYSMWNPVHGASKAAQKGWNDHVLVCGHKHTSGYTVVKDPMNGILSHCIQVASYKIYDAFAKTNGFPDQHISPHAVTVINPYADKERNLVQFFWDIDVAADYLTWLRGKWASGKSTNERRRK